MKFYYAPLEGITGYIYRNAHCAHFGSGVDKYFSPFIVADQTNTLKSKERNDLLPENNEGINLIPQILTNNGRDFNNTAKKIEAFGYKEINLNLGCPSGTVVTKRRGAGLLAYKDELNTLLEEIFANAVTEISVKTRLGIENPEEFHDLMAIFNQYPMKELIIHPRVQKDMYKNKPRLEIFRAGLESSKSPICYNGDIFSLNDYNVFTEAFPQVEAIMLGRGLLTNPGLVALIQSEHGIEKNAPIMDKAKLRAFHDQIYQDYQSILFGERNVLFKMKELWHYMIKAFSNAEKYAKKIKKAERLRDYDEAVTKLFNEQEILDTFHFH